jgi:hypothetical protein
VSTARSCTSCSPSFTSAAVMVAVVPSLVWSWCPGVRSVALTQVLVVSSRKGWWALVRITVAVTARVAVATGWRELLDLADERLAPARMVRTIATGDGPLPCSVNGEWAVH